MDERVRPALTERLCYESQTGRVQRNKIGFRMCSRPHPLGLCKTVEVCTEKRLENHSGLFHFLICLFIHNQQ